MLIYPAKYKSIVHNKLSKPP